MTTIRTVALSLIALVFAALPASIAIGALQQLVLPIDWSRSIEWNPSTEDVFLGTVYWYLMLFVPLLVGGVIHQVLLLGLTRFGTGRSEAVKFVLSSPLVLSGFFLVGGSGDALFSARVLLPAMGLLAVYCKLAWRSMRMSPRSLET